MIPRKYINAINDEIDKLGGYFTQRDVEDIKRRAVMRDEISDELDDALQEYIEDQMEEPMEENFQNTSRMVSYKSKFQEELETEVQSAIDGEELQFKNELRKLTNHGGERLLKLFKSKKLNAGQIDQIVEIYTVDEESRTPFHDAIDYAVVRYQHKGN